MDVHNYLNSKLFFLEICGYGIAGPRPHSIIVHVPCSPCKFLKRDELLLMFTVRDSERMFGKLQ